MFVLCCTSTIIRTATTTEAATLVHTMSERRNTLICCFDPASPRISAFDIHEWIQSQLQVWGQSFLMVQIDGTHRQAFIKFTDCSYVQYIVQTSNGTAVYKYTSGEISLFDLKSPGWGRVAYD
jgi:hypothetical protein